MILPTLLFLYDSLVSIISSRQSTLIAGRHKDMYSYFFVTHEQERMASQTNPTQWEMTISTQLNLTQQMNKQTHYKTKISDGVQLYKVFYIICAQLNMISSLSVLR